MTFKRVFSGVACLATVALNRLFRWRLLETHESWEKEYQVALSGQSWFPRNCMGTLLLAEGFRLLDPIKVCRAAHLQDQQRLQSCKTSLLLAISECAAWARDDVLFDLLSQELLARNELNPLDRNYLADLRLLRESDQDASVLPQHQPPLWSRMPWVYWAYSLHAMAKSGENMRAHKNTTLLSNVLSWIPGWMCEDRLKLIGLVAK